MYSTSEFIHQVLHIASTHQVERDPAGVWWVRRRIIVHNEDLVERDVEEGGNVLLQASREDSIFLVETRAVEFETEAHRTGQERRGWWT